MRFMNGLFEGMAAMMAAMIAIYLIVAFVLVYFAADAQSRRNGTRDPSLGARIVTTFLLTIVFQAAAAGLALFLGGLLDENEGAMKLGLGLVLGAAVSSILPLVIHKVRLATASAGTRDFVGRKALGINAIINGSGSVIGLMTLSVGVVMGGDVEPILIATTLVYTAAAVATLLPLSKAPKPE